MLLNGFLANAATDFMGTTCHIHNSTRHPVRTDDEILIATTQEVHMEPMESAQLQKEDEIRAGPPVVSAMQQVFRQAPSRPD
jgi:hypothetical protein